MNRRSWRIYALCTGSLLVGLIAGGWLAQPHGYPSSIYAVGVCALIFFGGPAFMLLASLLEDWIAADIYFSFMVNRLDKANENVGAIDVLLVSFIERQSSTRDSPRES